MIHPIANCRSCRAEIIWLRTSKGKLAPVNAETVTPDDILFDPKKHMNHFATCPQSAQWRKQKTKGNNETNTTGNS